MEQSKTVLNRLGITTNLTVRRWLEEVAWLGGIGGVAYLVGVGGSLLGLLVIILLGLGVAAQLLRALDESQKHWDEFYELGKRHGRESAEMEFLHREAESLRASMEYLNELRAKMFTQDDDEPWRGNEPSSFSD